MTEALFFAETTAQTSAATCPRGADVGEAELHLPAWAANEDEQPGWPLVALPVHCERPKQRLQLTQKQKGARARRRFELARKALAEARPPHPYFAACVCERCVSLKARKGVAA